MQNGNYRQNGNDNLLLAISVIAGIAMLTAMLSAAICGFVLDSFQSSNSMVMLLTDAGVKSDDKNLERNLSAATVALKACRDLGWALGVGSAGVAGAILTRLWRQNASGGKREG
jgi:hypothetical protein